MFDNKKILTIIRYYIIPLVLVPLIIFALFMAYMKVEDYKEERRMSSEATINGISAIFNGINNSVSEILLTYSDVDVFKKRNLTEDDRKIISALIENFCNRSSLQDLAFGTSTGEMFTPNLHELPVDFDPRFRPWYLDAVKAEGIAISSPYRDAIDPSKWTLSYGLKVLDAEGRVAGVLASDIKLKGIEHYFNEYFQNFKGRLIILDTNSRVVFEKNNGVIRLNDSKDIAFELIKEDGYDIAVEYDGIDYRMDKGSIKDMGWEIVLLTPSDWIVDGLMNILKSLALIFFLAVIVLNFFIIVLKNSVISPLEWVSERIDDVSLREHTDSVKFEAAMPKEMHIIEQAINRMLGRIQDQTLELQRQKEEINGQYEEINALYEETSAMNDSLNDLVDEIQDNYRNTIYALSSAIEANDAYTKGHCDRVKDYALKLGNVIGLSGSDLQTLEYAAILHDIGKVGIPDDILNKPSRLTDEEYEVVKMHPHVGAQILKDIPYLNAVCKVIEQHHERIDGRGYPNGIKEGEINVLAQILSIADAYDAMTSQRPYRASSLTVDEAITELITASGKQFSRRKVEVFIDILQKEQEMSE